MTELNNTCQICGRPIKAKNGIIAHHGYNRPGEGWQTPSCMGARYKPYEESSDRIPDAINEVKNHIENVKKNLNKFKKNPPEILIKSEYTGFSSRHNVEYKKPDDFNPKNPSNNYHKRYDSIFRDTIHQMEQDIKHSTQTLTYLEDRLDKWVKLR